MNFKIIGRLGFANPGLAFRMFLGLGLGWTIWAPNNQDCFEALGRWLQALGSGTTTGKKDTSS